MQQEANQFRQLGNHQTVPPSELSSKVLSAFESFLHNAGNLDGVQDIRELANFETEPPAGVTAKILDNYFDHSIKKNFWDSYKWKLLIAAAVLFFIAMIYSSTKHREENNQGIAVDINKIKNTRADSGLSLKESIPLSKDSTVLAKTINGPASVNHSVKINGQYGALLNNDIWFTFLDEESISQHTIKMLPEHVQTQIRMDDFTQIYLSPRWAMLLNESRESKKSGKPTFKARRTKRKLEKLKSREESFFRLQKNINPLNPIQLSNFMEQ